MESFSYTAKDRRGTKQSGTLDAQDKATALKQLEAMGLIPITLTPTPQKIPQESALSKAPPTQSTVRLTVDIPEKEPFEGKATQRQKQFIWDLGYRDKEAIADLGKKQASAVIDQLKAVQNRADKIGEGLGEMLGFGILLLICGFAYFESDIWLITLPAAIFGIFSLYKLLIGAIKTAWHKLMLMQQIKK